MVPLFVTKSVTSSCSLCLLLILLHLCTLMYSAIWGVDQTRCTYVEITRNATPFYLSQFTDHEKHLFSTSNLFFMCFRSESYCPHYERDTCLIHFKCCDEEEWYPCHKCHNEAVTLIEDQREIKQDNSKPLMDNSDDNSTASSISEEGECLEVGGSSQAENRREPEGIA